MFRVRITWMSEKWKREQSVIGHCAYEPTIGYNYILNIPIGYRILETDFGRVKSFNEGIVIPGSNKKIGVFFLTEDGNFEYEVLDRKGGSGSPLNVINLFDKGNKESAPKQENEYIINRLKTWVKFLLNIPKRIM